MVNAPKFVSLVMLWAGYEVFDFFCSKCATPATRQQYHRICWLALFTYLVFGFHCFLLASKGTCELYLHLRWHTGSLIWHGCHLMKITAVAVSLLVFACSIMFDRSVRTCQIQFCLEYTINLSAGLMETFLLGDLCLICITQKRIHISTFLIVPCSSDANL